MKNILAVEGAEQDEESDDEGIEILKGSIIPSDDIETKAMTKLNNQIVKSQADYKTTSNQLDLPMCKHTDIQPCVAIIPPTHEVRMKNARMKNQDNYAKLTSNAF